jgi:hypothetical protein
MSVMLTKAFRDPGSGVRDPGSGVRAILGVAHLSDLMGFKRLGSCCRNWSSRKLVLVVLVLEVREPLCAEVCMQPVAGRHGPDRIPDPGRVT